jgi:glycosyltransferase involved in cell wall biosynthesis
MYSSRPQKGLPVMLEALGLAKAQLGELAVMAYGGGPQERDLPLPAGSLYFQSAPQAKLRQVYSDCDAWLFGSSLEGFGLPILEAMACRTPVVGTPAGAAPELIGEGGGVLVDVDDPESMARGIVQVCSQSDAEWRRMSDAAFTTAQRHTWERATDAFEAGLKRAVTKTAIEDPRSKIEDRV